MILKTFFSRLGVLLILGSMYQCRMEEKVLPNSRFTSPAQIIEWIENPTEDFVLVAAHRGDWRHAPENSIQAIQNSLDMGVEIVEIDVRMTQDSQLVLMHDLTIDRTTTGQGLLADLTLDSLNTLFLKNGIGSTTAHRIPRFEEVLKFVKGKPILLNLDKAWLHVEEVYEELKKTGTVNQGIFKGNNPLEVMREKHGNLMDSIHYMPMVWPVDYSIYDREDIQTPYKYALGFIEGIDPLAFEVIYKKENSPVLEAIDLMEESDVSVWVNALWSELCAGHHDELAIHDPEAHWGWIIDHGANIIQTDRPSKLIDYLREKGLQD